MPKPKRQRPWRSARREHSPDAPAAPPAAFVRAYEADVTRDPAPPPRLIQWAGDAEDADDAGGAGNSAMQHVCADRHDVIHLLAALPARGTPPSPAGSASSSWSLPSDADETFELSGDEEVAAHAAARRRAWVDGLREARLREREREDADAAAAKQAAEDARNAEPPEDVLKLMRHTAKSLASSPNPALLEMRIVTRHGADSRFGFLRAGGQYSSAWARVRTEAGVKDNKPGRPAPKQTGLGNLMGGYSSGSDSGSGSSSEAGAESDSSSIPPPPQDEPPPPPPPPPPDDFPPPPSPPGSPPTSP